VTGKGISSNWTALAVLAVWSAIGIFFAIRGFSWEARRS
jgi:ABC-2 type transport system permease protein